MYQGDAMFLNSQGFGQLLYLVNQEINAVVTGPRRDQGLAKCPIAACTRSDHCPR